MEAFTIENSGGVDCIFARNSWGAPERVAEVICQSHAAELVRRAVANEPPPPVLPCVHLNGTSKTELLEQRSNVYAAIGEVLDVLRHMGPNGRDYYPAPGRMELAIKQHERRGEILRALQAEIEEEMNKIDKL